MPEASEEVDFVQVSEMDLITLSLGDWFVKGISTVCGAGDPRCRSGCAVYVYTCNSSMNDK